MFSLSTFICYFLVEELRNKATKKRGRGLDEPQTKRLAHTYDSLAHDGHQGPQRSVEVCLCYNIIKYYIIHF